MAAINSCKLNVQMRVKGGDYDWIIPPQNILLSKNTNADNIVCLFYPLPERTNIYDSDGESYNLDIDASKLANTYWSNSQRVTIPVGVPIKVTFVILDVPATVAEFSIAKFVYQLWSTNGDNALHYFEIRNQAISTQ